MPPKFPTVDLRLLEALEELFPDDLPRDPQADLGRLVGQQDVLDVLRNHHRKQNKKEPR